MKPTIAQLRDWLLEHRPFRMAQLEKDEAYPSQIGEALAELPTEIAEQLTQLAKALPSHPYNQQVIQEAVTEAISQWQETPDCVSNSLIILSSPVAAVARILTDSLADWVEQQALVINLLDWIERPLRSESIQSQMSETLGQTEREHEEKNIAVIPNLSWCFLRSAEGLDGIDYLRDFLLSDHTQFWVIGSGQVAWQYLNSVLKLQAYGGDVIQLPSLSGEQLQDWLMPIIEQLNIQFGDDSIQERLQKAGGERSRSYFKAIITLFEEVNASVKYIFRGFQRKRFTLASKAAMDEGNGKNLQRDNYFERLSDLSEGVSTTALQLFIKSIQYEEVSEEALMNETQNAEEIEDRKDSEPSLMHRLVARMPQLPNLPELEQNDLYILYSLLIHGDLTLNALAESLGEEQQTINNYVQVLRKAGLLEQQDKIIKVNPIHYSRLKKQLASENFIVQMDD